MVMLGRTVEAGRPNMTVWTRFKEIFRQEGMLCVAGGYAVGKPLIIPMLALGFRATTPYVWKEMSQR